MACVAGGLNMGAMCASSATRMFIFNLFVFTIMQERNSLGEGKFYIQI